MNTAYETYRLKAHVWLVGAGPGDPELMTVRAHKLVQSADVIFHEGNQINSAILALRKKEAILIDCNRCSPPEVAEQCGNFANQGRLVVRLYTGDPCIFSPALEEMKILREEGISCTLEPGISAVFWAAALAQKSLTPKHTHQAFTITRVPATSPLPPGQSIGDICRTGACLAIYLANMNPQNILDECLEAGLHPTTSILVIDSTGKNDERLVWLELNDLPAHFATKNKTQTLVLIWP